MAIEEKKDSTLVDGSIQEEEGKKDEIWYKIRPHHDLNFDPKENEIDLRVELPGIAKKEVNVKILPELFHVSGKSNHTLYQLTEYFPYLVDVDSVTASYDNGLLLMKAKFKDRLSDAVDIKIN
ncbi:MAG: Hsp20/alpha crystallin family protein [Promethearchaeota archaeon]